MYANAADASTDPVEGTSKRFVDRVPLCHTDCDVHARPEANEDFLILKLNHHILFGETRNRNSMAAKADRLRIFGLDMDPEDARQLT